MVCKKNILFFICALLMNCCETREMAVDNTICSGVFSKDKIEHFGFGHIDQNIDGLIKEYGAPLWIKDILSQKKIKDPLAVRNFDYSKGNYALWYSKQQNATLDFIRIIVTVKNGKITAISNEWYHE